MDSTDVPASPPRPEATAGRSLGRGLWRHRRLLVRLLGLLLVVVFVLQNSEPTTIDVLFWALPSAPKLVLILIGMGIGAAAWEVSRRLIAARRPR